ncbi:DUF6503 family protein [Aequorivita lipolytica]|uniref:Threonine synthase n=1 Tax=Aequorivita lipolytica TaxID=153267 RepID=A0A5C6YM41_9FLAO|nr:DUF6503 family protein [Aequorivita lipolytica]TXD68085.1 hypothetical protein ESV24_13855 [Aequorivita lipolytica]SRX53636.1 hypothetical protein AEQU2_02868 [Aequorivita lipolytica]
MKKLILLLTVLLALAACKNDKKTTGEDPRVEGTELDSTGMEAPDGEAKSTRTNPEKTYPSQLQSVFTAHGGLHHWKKMNNLCFEMKGKNGNETHTVSLPNRRTKIESKDWSIGYDGKGVWLLKHDLGYEGNPVFYHNLMFYFYAMPFIIADPGTNYTAVEATELDGKMYNGFKVSYNDGVGDSSDDEYILYFDPTTNKMAWLAYTVTFKDQKKSNDWHYIKYDQWQEVNGLLLPEKLTWWNVENGKPKSEKMDIKFNKIAASETMMDASVFSKPTEAEYVN